MSDALIWIYAAALGIGLFYALIQIFAQGLEGAFEIAHLDVSVDGHGDFGVSVLAVAWFLASFGATGLIALLGGGVGALLSLAIAVAGGIIFGAVAQMFFVKVLSETTTAHVSTSSLVGLSAEVTTPIEPDHLGQILLVAQGSRMTFSARATKRDISIPRGQLVRITDIMGSVAHVEPVVGHD
ncbi:MAG: hypothetical protein KJ064_02655 [Anaerolineae bacterium]|jgi:membrane protein implicated in regulation of membrane protease activity|nr:hypothetical protein [Anaerolineae bacterium]